MIARLGCLVFAGAIALAPGLQVRAAPDRAEAGPAPAADNAEIALMFEADQADRTTVPIDWKAVGPRDGMRRARIAALLASGAVRTGQDFHYAAVVYEHGGDPADYLAAHLLAIAAIARGRAEAQQIAAASLDRYLLGTGRAQILGTQFEPGADGLVQPDYDEKALPESLRAALGVSREALEARRQFLSRFIVPPPARTPSARAQAEAGCRVK